MGQATEENALRFSYLVSQDTDLEVAQMNAFSGCQEVDASADPQTCCVETITEYGQFALWSD